MSISFSGLASGLDTSSWVESLTALKQAKVTSLQKEKESVLLSQDTLSSIKQFFASFRSTIERITDTRFNIVSMDLFAQNIATSANLNVLTASATTEAEEGKYNVKVDKLATQTQAVSRHAYRTTIVETTTATADSKLINLGVTAGNIGVMVNGIEHGIEITNTDTIATFIEKLQKIGVDATYNENSGIFSMNVDKLGIRDIDGTGIVDALHLDGVNEGYLTFDKLEVSREETVWHAATTDTKLSELGVNAGTIVVRANDQNYNINITNATTIGSFIADLNANNIDAALDSEGIFTLSDAEITNEGATGIIDAMGLETDIYSKSQKTDGLLHETIVTETTTATSATLLKDIGDGTAISDGQTVIIKNSNNEYTTINVGTATTIGGLLTAMTNAGLYAVINNDGTVEISGGTITGGTFDAVSALGLEAEPYTAMVTGNSLTETIIEYELVTYDTRLVDDLGVSEGYLEVTDADGNIYYEKIYSGQTIGDLMGDFANLGLYTSLDQDNGILEITGGAFRTLTDADVQALVNNNTIAETDARYIKGTDLLECLYGAGTISTDQIAVASAYSRTRALTQSVTNIVNATTATTLGTLGLTTNGTATFNVRGNNININVTADMTIQGLMDALAAQGIESSWDVDHSRLTVNNATLDGGTSNLTDVLNMETTISGKYVTSTALSAQTTIAVDATRETTFAELGVNTNETVILYKEDGSEYTFNVSGTTTMGAFLDTLNANGVTAKIEDGIFSIQDGYITNTAIETALGLTTKIDGYSNILGNKITHTIETTATGDTTLGEIVTALGTASAVSGGYNMSFNSHALNVSASTTLDELMMQIYSHGGTANIDSAGRLHIDGGTLSGTVATALGFSSVSTTAAVGATGEILEVITTLNADTTNKLSDIGLGASTITIKGTDDEVIGTITTHADMTIGDLFSALAGYGITGTMKDGVITLTSDSDRYATGGVIDSLGIGTTVTNFTTTAGVINTSTETVSATYTITADSSTKLSSLGYNAATTITVSGDDGTLVGTVTTNGDMTIGDVLTALAGYDISGTIENGVIKLDSAEGHYVTGGVLASMGVTTTAGSYTTTAGVTVTSSAAVTGTVTQLATMDSVIKDFITLPTSKTITVKDKTGADKGTVTVTDTMTFEQLFKALDDYGVQGTISDGVISVTSNDGRYLTGDVLTQLGITTTTSVTTVTTTAGTSTTGSAITYTQNIVATMTSAVGSFVNLSSGNTITVKNKDGGTKGSVNITSSMTFMEMFDKLSSLGVQGTISDGVVSLTSNDGSYATGTVLTNMGIDTRTTTVDLTTGISKTSSDTITYTSTTYTTTLASITQTITTTSTITVTEPVISTVTITVTDTFTVNEPSIGEQTIITEQTITVLTTIDVVKTVEIETTDTIVVDMTEKYTTQVSATGSTKLADLGVTDFTVTIKQYKTDGTVADYYTTTLASTSNVQDFLNTINNNSNGKLTASISDGIITVTGPTSLEDYAVTGGIANKLGLYLNDNRVVTTVGNNVQSTAALKYIATTGNTMTSSSAITYKTTTSSSTTSILGIQVTSTANVTYTTGSVVGNNLQSTSGVTWSNEWTLGSSSIGAGTTRVTYDTSQYGYIDTTGGVCFNPGVNTTTVVVNAETLGYMDGHSYDSITIVLTEDANIAPTMVAGIRLNQCNFNGQGYVITADVQYESEVLSYFSSGDAIADGFFAEIVNSTIENLNYEANSSSGTSNEVVDSVQHVVSGGLVGLAMGSLIRNCNIYVNMDPLGEDSGSTGGYDPTYYAGAIAGKADGCSIQNCAVSGLINGEDVDYVGGVVGYLEDTTLSNIWTGFFGLQGDKTGGLAGYISYYANAYNCFIGGSNWFHMGGNYSGLWSGSGTFTDTEYVESWFSGVKYAGSSQQYASSGGWADLGSQTGWIPSVSTSGGRGAPILSINQGWYSGYNNIAVYNNYGSLFGFVQVDPGMNADDVMNAISGVGGLSPEYDSSSGSVSIPGAFTNSSQLITAMNLQATNSDTYSSGFYYQKGTIYDTGGSVQTLTASTTLGELADAKNIELTSDTMTLNVCRTNGTLYTCITLTTETSINSLNSTYSSILTASVDANGKVTLTPKTGYYFEYLPDNNALRHSLVSLWNLSGGGSTSSSTTHTANADTGFEEIGCGGGTIGVYNTAGELVGSWEIDVGGSDAYISAMLDFINYNGYGTASIDSSTGRVTINPASGYYLDICSDIVNALKLNTGQGWTTTVTSTSTTLTLTATGSTTFGQLEGWNANYTFNFTVVNISTGASYTYEITATTSFNDLKSWFETNNYGSMSISNGILTIDPADDYYVPDNGSSFVGITHISNWGYSTTQIDATVATTLGQLGMSETGTIVFGSTSDPTGAGYTITVSPSLSILDLNDAIGVYAAIDLDTMQNSHICLIGCRNGYYIKSISDNLASALKITKTPGYTVNASGEVSNSNSNYLFTLNPEESVFADTVTVTTTGSATITIQTVTSSTVVVKHTHTVECTTTTPVTYTVSSEFTVESTSTHDVLVTVIGTGTVETTTFTITTTDSTATLVNDTRFRQLELNGTYYITVNSSGTLYTVTVNSSDTVGEMLTSLAGLGIHGSIENGKLTLKGDKDAFITQMTGDLQTKLKLSGSYYSTSTVTTGVNTTSDLLNYNTAVAVTTDTLMSQRGITVGGSNTITIQNNGVNYTVTVHADDTIGEVLTALAGHGISGEINNGAVTLSGSGDAYVTAMGDNVKTALGITDIGLGHTYSTTQVTGTSGFNSLSNVQDRTINVSLTSASTFAELGMSGSGTINLVSDGVAYTITVESTDTVDDMLTTLAGLGISGSVDANKIRLQGDSNAYITSISDNIETALKLATNTTYNTTATHTTQVNGNSNTQQYSTTNVLTTDDTFSRHGLSADGTITVVSDGTQYVVTVQASDTIDDVLTTLAGHGIAGYVENGKISLQGDDEAYITGISSNLNTVLKLGATNYTTTGHTTTTNTNSNQQKQTITAAATGTTQLKDLRHEDGSVIAGYDLILSTTSDAGNQLVTLNFTATSTLYDVMDTLASYGLNAYIDVNGRFGVNSSSLTDFDISGNLGTFIMGAYTKVYDEGQINSVSTNLIQETVVNMDDNTLMSKIGITNGNLVLYKDGIETTIAIDNTKTIGDFRNKLAELGLNTAIVDGRLQISGDGVIYFTDPATGASNIISILGLDNNTSGSGDTSGYSQISEHLFDTQTITHEATMANKLSELTDASGTSLGITNGSIYVYQDGTRNLINIDTNDTLETLASKLSQYGITVGIDQNGQVYFDGNNNSYLTTDGIASASASNILTKFNISNNWSTRYNSTSEVLDYEVESDIVADGKTKLSDLQDADGNNLGITNGTYYVYQNGVRNTETITDDTTVDDFLATMATYGMSTNFNSDGSISVGGYNETYLATSATSGDDTNAIDILFEQWNFVNVYTSNNLDIPTDVTVAISETTKLADINEGTYQAGFITVVKDSVQTDIQLTADDTVGDLMNELALYGFESTINANGQLIIKNTGDSLLQAYAGAGTASNALDILGIDLDEWINTNTYGSDIVSVVTTTTEDISATRDTLLSELGVTTGEYYIYNNGVKNTALISSDETVGSLMDTLASFGLQASLVDNGAGGSVISITGNGNSYIAKTASTNASNVVNTLFVTADETFAYQGLEQTSEIVTHYSAATEETLLSYYDNGLLTAAGDLNVSVNGVESSIKIGADETFGSLINKLQALGVEATLSDGELMIQSGYDVFTILDTSTSSLLATINMVYHDDLGGYVASTDTALQTTTTVEDRTLSVASYAGENTKLSQLNISSGTLTIYRNGEKATLNIDSEHTLGDLNAQIAGRFSDVRIKFKDGVLEDGILTIYSTNNDVSVEIGSTTDTSNFGAVTGVSNDGSGIVKSAREIYCVNGDSVITTTGIFRNGNVTEGTFYVGDAEFTITDTTKLSNLISQINSSEGANATAYWDSIDGKLVIKSRTTGSALVNIEAGTSNFTDIMGFTNSEWDATTGDLTVTKMNVDAQEIGENAQFSINGTYYTSTSNTIGSDVSRIKGLTINLKGISEGASVELTVERDKETVANAVSDIVDAYNDLIENVDKEIAKGSPLDDQTTLRLIRNQIRNLMTGSIATTGVFKNLDSIGISLEAATAGNIQTDNINILSFNKEKFLDAFDADRDSLKTLLVGTDANLGIFQRVEKLVESAVGGASGFFASAEKSYNNQIQRLDKKIESAQRAVERYRERLEAKFQAMDMLISNIQNQYSSFLGT